MTSKAKVFTEIITDICWMKGWNTTGITEKYPRVSDGEELSWLVDNGYLFHYVQHRTGGSRQSWGHYHATDHNMYGVTRKGWKVAPDFIKAMQKENPSFKISYMYPDFPRMPE